MPDPIQRISATAPPTIANMAVGFDLLGMAVKGLGDIVTIEISKNEGVHIKAIHGDSGRLPLDAKKNTATAGMLAMIDDLIELNRIEQSFGIDVVIHKRMALGTGLGSSASSAAAGVMALNGLLGNPLTKEELSPYALIGESMASGAIHGDNVIPSLMGGTWLIRETQPLDMLSIPSFPGLAILLIHPHVEVLTSQSRSRLRPQVSLQAHIKQSADLAAFIQASHTQDIDLLKRSLNDHIIGPQRRQDIPYMDESQRICLQHSALNYDISGSGPSAFGFFEKTEDARSAMVEIQGLFKSQDLKVDTDITSVDLEGAKIIQF